MNDDDRGADWRCDHASLSHPRLPAVLSRGRSPVRRGACDVDRHARDRNTVPSRFRRFLSMTSDQFDGIGIDVGGPGFSFREDSSVRSDGNALTMLLCSASGISVTYCCRTRNTTTRSVRIYPWRRIRRSRVPSTGPGTFFAAQFSAGCTTNIAGFDLRQAQVSYPASPCLTFWRVGVVRIFQVAPAMPTNDSLRLDELRTVGTLPRVAHLFPLRPHRDLDQAPENAVSGSSGGGVRLY